MADVHEGDHELEVTLALEVALHEVVPALLLRGVDAREAVAGQVDEVHVADGKEVDGRGLARLGGDLDEVLAAEELVHERGLAHVRAADEGDLRASGLRELLGGAGAHRELYEVVVHVISPFLSGDAAGASLGAVGGLRGAATVAWLACPSRKGGVARAALPARAPRATPQGSRPSRRDSV